MSYIFISKTENKEPLLREEVIKANSNIPQVAERILALAISFEDLRFQN